MSPFRSEDATLEEHRRRLEETLLALESEAARLARERASLRQPSFLGTILALGILGGAALVGVRLGAVATAVLTYGVDARADMEQWQELRDETAKTDQCAVLREEENGSLLACKNAYDYRHHLRNWP